MEGQDVLSIIRKNPNMNYFISASAGTGKTYTITQYYISILEFYEKKNYPEIVDEIVAVTFTRKAAGEMKERITKSIKEKIDKRSGNVKYWRNVQTAMSRAIISTIDSFCQRILREENLKVGIDPNFTIISDVKAAKLIDKAVYLTLKYTFEIYDNGNVEVTTRLSSYRRQKVKELLDELLLYKNGIKVLFERMKSVGIIEELLRETLVNWRTEIKMATISSAIEDIAKDASEALKAFRIMVLIAKEIYEGNTIDNFEFDFKAILEKTIEIFDDDEINEKYKNRYKYIIVDEFQDTNYLQKELFDKLHSDNNYIFYVGDRKQSIYRFRGADVSVFIRTQQEFEQKEKEGKNYKVLALKDNYRSHPELVSFFNTISRETLFNKNIITSENNDDVFFYEVFKTIEPSLYEKLWFSEKLDNSNAKLICEKDKIPGIFQEKGSRIKYILINQEKLNKEKRIKAEAEAAAFVINSLVGKELKMKKRSGEKIEYEVTTIKYGDFAILRSRIANVEEVYQEVFRNHGIPLYIVGGKNFYNRLEIKAVLSALYAVQNPNNNFYFTQFFFSPLVMGDFKSYDKIVSSKKDKKDYLFQVAKQISGELNENIQKALKILEKYAELKYYIRPTEVLKGLIKDLNYFEKLTYFKDYKNAILNVKKLLLEASNFDQIASSFSELVRLIKRLNESVEAEASLEDETSDSVKLMSIHASKGLEFKIVLLGDLFSEKRRSTNKENLQFTHPDSSGKRYYVLKKFINEFKDDFPAEKQEKFQEALKEFYINDVYDATEARRKLYVAITRASEMFIPILFAKDPGEPPKSYFANIKELSSYGVINVNPEDIKINSENIPAETIFSEKIPPENLSDFRKKAYRMYISPTSIYNFLPFKEIKEKELSTEFLEEPDYMLNFQKLFLEETFEGSDIHKKLASVNKLSQLKYLEEIGILKIKLSENQILAKLFETSEEIFSEWRLVKHVNYEGKDYMLFGIPDKVFKINGDFIVVDFKHSEFPGKGKAKQLQKYDFQLKFYMYLLKDFGKVKEGYIISTRTGETIKIMPPEDSFENTIFELLKLSEKVEQ
ncbi:UvrD-helicase domain-containing protein [Thermosipho ferrireducens]|uniref:UvrD-helicase domain-containing protein n=1 Tax=Thermosipho ferrireducens TaxID=2571116 RepID=UPI001D18FA26|nr:UvrD-helicase domain-containing protein [Thermosipho ferrireducens]